MIQRIQTIWLVIAAACAFGTYWFPIYKGNLAAGTEKLLILPDQFPLFLLIFGLGVLAAIIIFLFKKRNLQYRLCIIGVLVSVAVVILEYSGTESFKQENNFQSGSYQIGAFLPILMIILFILAARAIRKDEKLVKSVDRLR